MTNTTPEPIQLTPFRWWHIPHILPHEQELFGNWSWSAQTYWTELAAPDRWYTIATCGTEICGWVGLASNGAEGDVQTIAVTSAAQGTGLGHRLLTALLTEAHHRNLASVLLEVRADNIAAQKLYLKNGFEQIAVRRRYYQPGDVDALIMRARIPAHPKETS